VANKGRPKKPTELKILEGNRGKRPLPENEPKPAPITNQPDPPEWLNDPAKGMWQRLFPILQRINLITEADLESYTMLCQSYGKWVEHEKDIADNGDYYTYTNKAGAENEVERPAVKLAHKAYERYKSLCTEFGLTAASRARIETKGADDDVEEMEELLSK